MSSPGGARNAPENEATVAFLRERIRMAKQQMEAAAESFFWYCLALYESSIYATDGVAPTGFVPPN